MNNRRTILLGTLFSVMAPIWGYTADHNMPLTNDYSREELFEVALTKLHLKALPRQFVFPKNVKTGLVYGIDVSHHNGTVDWNMVAAGGVQFIYVKASQGTDYFDPRFTANWKAIGALQEHGTAVKRGAYHFFSAGVDGAKQAENFLSVVGSLKQDDLPPVLDLEWDMTRPKSKSEAAVDRWDKIPKEEIIQEVKAFQSAVKAKTGKTPLIYTSFQWWRPHLGQSPELAQYPIWVCDMATKALNDEAPQVLPPTYHWTFWQLTDRATIAVKGSGKAAASKRFDANRFNGSVEDFEQLTKLAQQ